MAARLKTALWLGIQAIVYNKAIIGRDCLIAAGAIVTEGKVFFDRSLIV